MRVDGPEWVPNGFVAPNGFVDGPEWARMGGLAPNG